MTRYHMSDDTVVNTDNASMKWKDDSAPDGNGNEVFANSRSDRSWSTLYRSRKGRYYLVHYSRYTDHAPHAEWVSNEVACRWLLTSHREISDLPADLRQLVDTVSE